MEIFALGILKMSEADFHQTTPRTFANIVEGYNTEYRLKMEMHRESIVTMLLPHMSAADRNKPIAKLYPLAWDKQAVKGLKPPQNPAEFWAEIDEKEKVKNALASKHSPSASK